MQRKTSEKRAAPLRTEERDLVAHLVDLEPVALLLIPQEVERDLHQEGIGPEEEGSPKHVSPGGS
ncbi:MAG: hypothetical protein AB7O52_19720 [Planctomycetota bacterium]